MNSFDDAENGEEVVRSFMLTRGRTRADADELAIETLVSTSDAGRLHARRMSPQQQRILDDAIEPISVAELSAHQSIPLRAAVVLTSEMVAKGILIAEATVDEIDASFLSKIRTAFGAL